ncbi:hypothetical protein BZA77DRAFT_295218 [Pyronema omphalodes]|nr:hypothetical protein BZA77DRAFT_295705 [Pyronema omphalodes]KAI5814359.1 hypothetical protein BZA77DRAFT_295218 [Pyronema omphalodes]
MDKSADTQAKPSEENGSHLRLRSNTETSKYSSTTEQQISGGSSQNEGSVINSETDPMDTTRRRRRVISFPKVARSSTGFLLNQRHTMNYDDCVTSPFEDEKEEYEDKEEDKDEDEDKEWVERERLSRQLDEEFSEGVDYATFTKQPTQRRNSRLTFFSIKSDEDDGPWEQEDDLNLDYDSDTYEYHDPWYSSTITNGKFARGGEIADVYDELSGNGIRYCTRKKKERRPTSCICSRFNGAKNNRNVITEAIRFEGRYGAQSFVPARSGAKKRNMEVENDPQALDTGLLMSLQATRHVLITNYPLGRNSIHCSFPEASEANSW